MATANVEEGAKAASKSNEKETTTAKMLAFRIEKSGDSFGKVVEVDTPEPEKPGYALVRVLRAGVCNTDLEILKGYMGFEGTLGHEFVGVVEGFHPGTSQEIREKWMGKRVCGDINVGCGECEVCTDADGLDKRCSQMSRNHCPHRSVLGILKRDGTMAEYLTLPAQNLHAVPDGVSDEVAAFAEPLAAACRIVEQNLVDYSCCSCNGDDDGDDGESNGIKRKTKPDRVCILGDGKLGLMIAEVLGREHTRRFGSNAEDFPPKPILFGKHRHKLDLVEGGSGVDTRLVSECRDEKAFNGVSAEFAGKFDVVVDATGNPSGLQLAAALCRPMGTLVLKSTCAAGSHQFNAAPFVIDELRVVGSRCGPVDTALELLAIDDDGSDGRGCDDVGGTKIKPLGVTKYVTRTFPLEQAEEAIRFAAERSTMKVQIVCSGSGNGEGGGDVA